jgi:hypothetical protein
VGLWSMGLVCLKGTGQWNGDPACVWIPGLTGLEALAAEWRLWVCGSLALQALGVQACKVNIVQGCAGLGGMAGKAEVCKAGGHSPAKQSSCRVVQAWRGCGTAEIINVCGSLA